MLRPLRMILLLLALPVVVAAVAPAADQMLVETVGRLKKFVETGKPE